MHMVNKLRLQFAILVIFLLTVAPAQSEIAYWTFDSANPEIVVDESGNANHGELVGNPVFVEGFIGSGLQLDGRTQHMTVSASVTLDGLDEFSFSSWVIPDHRGLQYILSKDGRDLSLALNGTDLYLKGCIKTNPLVCSRSFNGSIGHAKWQFIAMTYDDNGDRRVHLYIDGVEVDYHTQGVALQKHAIDSDPTTSLAIGAMAKSGFSSFGGRIDEARVFDIALNASEILALYHHDRHLGGSDISAPSVEILQPAPDNFQTTLPAIDISGTAADDTGVIDVTWLSDQGPAGAASGTGSWVAAAIPLKPGLNHLTVTALDAAGNAGIATLSVLYSAEAEPEFQGYGASTTGGAGFPVYVAASAGEFSSLLQHVSDKGGGATIMLSGSWIYSSDVKLIDLSHVTLDGRGSAVTLANSSVIVKCSENIVVQGLRIRNDQTGDDAIQVNSSSRVVIDHNSVSGAGDGNIDITGWSCGASRDITVSWNFFADTWKQSLVKYGDTSRVSFHHNLFYNSGNRLPSLASKGEFDVRNNVFWQWANSGTALSSGARANIVGNFYEIGRSLDRARHAIWYVDSTSQAWIQENVLPSAELDVSRLAQPLATPPTTTHEANLARDLVIAQGGSWPRDAYDSMLTSNIEKREFPPPPPFHE